MEEESTLSTLSTLSTQPVIPAPSIAAFYQCFHNPKNFLAAVKSFRFYYPTETLVIHNDGGLDYSYIANKYNATYFYHSRAQTEDGDSITDITQFRVIKYLRNLWKTAEIATEDYILILEDDVRILRKVQCELMYVINGINRCTCLNPSLLARLPANTPAFYGGFGGSLIQRSFLCNIPFSQVETLVRTLTLPSYACDMTLSFVVRVYGGTIGQYVDYTECWHCNFLYRAGKGLTAVLHQYKYEYTSPLTKEENDEIWPPAESLTTTTTAPIIPVLE